MCILKTRTIILSIISILLFTSCNTLETYENSFVSSTDYYFYPTSRDLIFNDYYGYSVEFSLYGSSEIKWEITDLPDWLSAHPVSGEGGQTVTINAEKSLTDQVAVFHVTATLNGMTSNIAITATNIADIPFVKFADESNTVEVSATGGNISKEVQTNVSDLAAFSSESWAIPYFNNDSQTLSVEVLPNYTDNAQVCVVTLKSSEYSISAYLRIQQHPSGFTVDNSTVLEFEAQGGTQSRSIQSDLEWTAKKDDSWIEVAPESGSSGNNEVQITTLPSYNTEARTGYVYFYYGDTQKDYLTIRQAGAYLNVSATEISLSALNPDTEKFDVNSSTDWSIYSCPDWVTLNPKSGTAGFTSVNVSAGANESINGRSGIIEIRDTATGSLKSSVTVKQGGLSTSEETIEFGWKASSKSIPSIMTAYFTVSSPDSWITATPIYKNGAYFINIEVENNHSENSRSGIVNVMSDNEKLTITVLQQGQYINIENTASSVPQSGGNIELSYTSSVDIYPSVEYTTSPYGWISYTSRGDNVYDIKVAENPSSIERKASFILLPADESATWEGVEMQITQAGRDVTCSVSKIEMPKKGGTSETYKITADGRYSISKKDGESAENQWFTIVADDQTDTFYVECESNDTGSARTGKILIKLVGLPEGEYVTRAIEVVQ